MSCTCALTPDSMASPARFTFASSIPPRRRSCARMSMLESGVRSSWERVAKNSSLASPSRSPPWSLPAR